MFWSRETLENAVFRAVQAAMNPNPGRNERAEYFIEDENLWRGVAEASAVQNIEQPFAVVLFGGAEWPAGLSGPRLSSISTAVAIHSSDREKMMGAFDAVVHELQQLKGRDALKRPVERTDGLAIAAGAEGVDDTGLHVVVLTVAAT